VLQAFLLTRADSVDWCRQQLKILSAILRVDFCEKEKEIERQIKSVFFHDKSFKKYSTYPAGTQDVAISVLDALKNLIYSKKKTKQWPASKEKFDILNLD
jgi:hypothetical protein